MKTDKYVVAVYNQTLQHSKSISTNMNLLLMKNKYIPSILYIPLVYLGLEVLM